MEDDLNELCWQSLRRIEDQLIQLDSTESLTRIVAHGCNEVSPDDLQNALWGISHSVEAINQNMDSEFQKLWENFRLVTIKQDSHNPLTTNAYIKPSAASTEVNNIVNSWIKQ